MNTNLFILISRYFSQSPHIAGTVRQKELADFLASKWKEYGFDRVEMPEYKVLLSYPEKDKPNIVSIVNNGKVEYDIVGKIKVRLSLSNRFASDLINNK